MKFLFLFLSWCFVVLLLSGCAQKETEVTYEMIDQVIQENKLSVIDTKKTSQGVVFIFFKTLNQAGAYTLSLDNEKKLVTRNSAGPFDWEGTSENKVLLVAYIDGAMGLIIDDEDILLRVKHFNVYLDGEMKKQIEVDKSERAYIIEIDSFIRNKNQKVSIEFYDFDNVKIK